MVLDRFAARSIQSCGNGRIWNNAKRHLGLSLQRRRQVYNAHRATVPFKQGDKVFLKDHPVSNRTNKFSPKSAYRFKGPFELVKFYTPVTVELRDPEGQLTRAHVSQLKPSYDQRSISPCGGRVRIAPPQSMRGVRGPWLWHEFFF